MAQKTNPIALRLGIKQFWYSNNKNPITLGKKTGHYSDKNNIFQDLFIRRLISGLFESFGYLSSEIIIHRKPLTDYSQKRFTQNMVQSTTKDSKTLSVLANQQTHVGLQNGKDRRSTVCDGEKIKKGLGGPSTISQQLFSKRTTDVTHPLNALRHGTQSVCDSDQKRSETPSLDILRALQEHPTFGGSLRNLAVLRPENSLASSGCTHLDISFLVYSYGETQTTQVQRLISSASDDVSRIRLTPFGATRQNSHGVDTTRQLSNRRPPLRSTSPAGTVLLTQNGFIRRFLTNAKRTTRLNTFGNLEQTDIKQQNTVGSQSASQTHNAHRGPLRGHKARSAANQEILRIKNLFSLLNRKATPSGRVDFSRLHLWGHNTVSLTDTSRNALKYTKFTKFSELLNGYNTVKHVAKTQNMESELIALRLFLHFRRFATSNMGGDQIFLNLYEGNLNRFTRQFSYLRVLNLSRRFASKRHTLSQNAENINGCKTASQLNGLTPKELKISAVGISRGSVVQKFVEREKAEEERFFYSFWLLQSFDTLYTDSKCVWCFARSSFASRFAELFHSTHSRGVLQGLRDYVAPQDASRPDVLLQHLNTQRTSEQLAPSVVGLLNEFNRIISTVQTRETDADALRQQHKVLQESATNRFAPSGLLRITPKTLRASQKPANASLLCWSLYDFSKNPQSPTRFASFRDYGGGGRPTQARLRLWPQVFLKQLLNDPFYASSHGDLWPILQNYEGQKTSNDFASLHLAALRRLSGSSMPSNNRKSISRDSCDTNFATSYPFASHILQTLWINAFMIGDAFTTSLFDNTTRDMSFGFFTLNTHYSGNKFETHLNKRETAPRRRDAGTRTRFAFLKLLWITKFAEQLLKFSHNNSLLSHPSSLLHPLYDKNSAEQKKVLRTPEGMKRVLAPNSISFHIRELPSYVLNAKIISDYIRNEMSLIFDQDPRKHAYLFKSILKEAKRVSQTLNVIRS